MRFVRTFLAAALLAACSGLALAAGPTATVSWTAPTAYENGAALAPTDLAYYTVTACYKGTQQCVSFQAAPATAGTAPPVSLVVPLVCGDYTMTVTATTTAAALYPSGTSPPSSPAVAYATGVTCSPNAPAGVSVVAGGTLPGGG